MEDLILIGVLSDTHVNARGRSGDYLRTLCRDHFAAAEVILHAGDLVDPDVLTLFDDKTVYAVRGNLDPPGQPIKRVIALAGRKIGLIHGWGAPGDLEKRVLQEFSGETLDCLVYGHSHLPACHEVNGVLLFNPGSPTDRRFAPYHSIGLLEITPEGITGRIIPVSGI